MPTTINGYPSLPSKTVLQVVSGGRTTQTTHNSNTFTDVGVSVDITPTSTSSKVLVIVTGTLSNSLAGNQASLLLLRGSTSIGVGTGASNVNAFTSIIGEDDAYILFPFGQQVLDSPSTTSTITYKIQMNAINGVAKLGGRGDSTETGVPTVITAMEIQG